jgi:putative membrane protein
MQRNQARGWLEKLLSHGVDPDPRFSLANERTFLAWIRPSLGMIALGVGIATFVSHEQAHRPSLILAGALVILGGVVSAGAWLRWLRVERAMRLQHGLPPSRLAPFIAIGIAAIAAIAIITVVIAA